MRVGIGGWVSVMVGSNVGVVSGVKVISGVAVGSGVGDIISGDGELVAEPAGCSVGWIVAGGIGVRVATGEGVAVAGTQAARIASRVHVRKMPRCISKLYPFTCGRPNNGVEWLLTEPAKNLKRRPPYLEVSVNEMGSVDQRLLFYNL